MSSPDVQTSAGLFDALGRPLRLLMDEGRARAAGLVRAEPATPGNAVARYLRAVLLHQAQLRSPELSRQAAKRGPGRMHGGKARPAGSKLWRRCPSAYCTEEGAA